MDVRTVAEPRARAIALAGREPRAEIAGAAALKTEPAQKLSPAEQLEELTAPPELRTHARAHTGREARRGQGQRL